MMGAMNTYRVTDTNNNEAELRVFTARDQGEAEILGRDIANDARVVVYRLWAQQIDGGWLQV